MQKARDAHRERCTSTTTPEEARRLLEDPDAMSLEYRYDFHRFNRQVNRCEWAPFKCELFREEQFVASLCEHRVTTIREIHKATWVLWCYDELWWSHFGGLLLLQGATHQQILGERIILLSGDPLPVSSPRLGLQNVTVAGMLEAPDEWSAKDIFMAIHEEALHRGSTTVLGPT